MIEVGVLTPEEKVELLEGYIVLELPRGPLHDATNDQMLDPLREALPSGWRLRVRSGFTLSDSQTQPDFAAVRRSPEYKLRHPGPADAGLLIEVANASLDRDRLDKTRIYARGGIPYYWIVNLVDRRIEVYSQPSGPTEIPAYHSFQLYQPGDSVPLILDGNTVATIPVADLLG
jgi:Uma2 family endonuclease